MYSMTNWLKEIEDAERDGFFAFHYDFEVFDLLCTHPKHNNKGCQTIAGHVFDLEIEFSNALYDGDVEKAREFYDKVMALERLDV